MKFKKTLIKAGVFFLAAIIFLLGLIATGLYLTKTKVNDYLTDIEQNLNSQFNETLKIGDIKLGWSKFSLVIKVKEISVQDKITKVYYFSANDIVASVDLWETIFARRVKLSYLNLGSPKVAISRNNSNQFVVVGLPQKLEVGEQAVNSLTEILSDDFELELRNANLQLQLQPNVNLSLRQINGKFHKELFNKYKFTANSTLAGQQDSKLSFKAYFWGDLKEWRAGKAKFEVKGQKLETNELLTMLPHEKFAENYGSLEKFLLEVDWQQGGITKGGGNFNFKNVKFLGGSYFKSGSAKAYFDAGESINFELSSLQYGHDKFFGEIIEIPKVSGEILQTNSADEINFKSSFININFKDFQVKLNLALKYAKGQFYDPQLKFLAKKLAVANIYSYLPTKGLTAETLTWFKTAFKSKQGIVYDSTLDVRNNNFALALNFKNTTLNYTEGWPELQKLTGKIIADKDKVELIAETGVIADAKLATASAEITNLQSANNSRLKVKLNILTTLDKGVNFLNNSPLRHLGQELIALKPQGKMNLNLTLEKKLAKAKTAMTAQGELKVADSTLVMLENLELEKLKGDINFTDKSFNAENLVFKVLAKAGGGRIDFSRENKLGEIKLSFPANAEEIKMLFPALTGLDLTGDTNFTVKAAFPDWKQNFNKELIVESDLQGLAITLPPPLAKGKANKRGFKLTVTNVVNQKIPGKKGLFEGQRVALNYADAGQAKLLLHSGKVIGGHIVVGKQAKADWSKRDIIYVGGVVEHLDFETWRKILTELSLVKYSDKFSNKFELDILAHVLKISNLTFKNTRLRYNSADKMIALLGDKVEGRIKYSAVDSPLELNFKKLYLNSKDVNLSSVITSKLQGVPLVFFNGDEVKYNDYNLGAMTFTLLPKSQGYEIDSLTVNGGDKGFSFHGAGGNLQEGNKKQSQLFGTIESKDMGGFLQDLGLGSSISKGRGNLDFILSWAGDLHDFKAAKSSGNVDVNIENGQLKGVDPGLGRVVGLLSLDNIKRRLNLDFSDVFGSGFAFDKLTTKFELKKGVLTTLEDIVIDGPSARIILFGKAKLENKKIDFKLDVTPKVGASLPLAAAIAAGNPAVGAAVWLADKFTSKKPSKVNKEGRFQYQVTGTWDKPDIKEIEAVTSKE